jgi:hypothetical protein
MDFPTTWSCSLGTPLAAAEQPHGTNIEENFEGFHALYCKTIKFLK